MIAVSTLPTVPAGAERSLNLMLLGRHCWVCAHSDREHEQDSHKQETNSATGLPEVQAFIFTMYTSI